MITVLNEFMADGGDRDQIKCSARINHKIPAGFTMHALTHPVLAEKVTWNKSTMDSPEEPIPISQVK